MNEPKPKHADLWPTYNKWQIALGVVMFCVLLPFCILLGIGFVLLVVVVDLFDRTPASPVRGSSLNPPEFTERPGWDSPALRYRGPDDSDGEMK